jgi:hypothetical protein
MLAAAFTAACLAALTGSALAALMGRHRRLGSAGAAARPGSTITCGNQVVSGVAIIITASG